MHGLSVDLGIYKDLAALLRRPSMVDCFIQHKTLTAKDDFKDLFFKETENKLSIFFNF